MKIRRGAVGGEEGCRGVLGLRMEGARRLYLGHPGRHSPRSIAEPARAARSLAPSAADYLTRLAHCPTNINYFLNRLLYELFRQILTTMSP